jgi:hypothetical protein
MTPEQMAEMEAYMKAGTPGAPPMEETGTATRTMGLDGRVLIEEIKSSMTARMISRRSSPTTQIFEMHGPVKDGKEMKMTYTKK